MARKISEATAATTIAGTEELPVNQSSAAKKVTINQIKTFVAAAPASHASQHAAAGADPVTLAQSQVTSLTTDLAGKKTDSMATGKLLGRGTAGTGVIEEITLGTNLSLTGTTLNAAGGSGSGDVTGPSSAGDGNLAVFNGITGKIIKDGGVITAAGKAILDDSTAADQRTTLGLGGAAVLSVGTTTGTVAAGDDSRLSDARTPVAHNQGTATVTFSATGRLLGRSTASGGAGEEISLGTNLSFSGNTLNATMSGGGGGDVYGPASATDGAVALFDGATGKTLKNGVVLGSLATQSGTFSGTSSGTNTGDQTLSSLGAASQATLSAHTSQTVSAHGGLVPDSRTVNGFALTGDITLSALDVGGIAKSIGTTKGDIIAFTASGTPVRLAVGGTNGHVLTVDSAESTGLKYAAAAGGSGNPEPVRFTIGGDSGAAIVASAVPIIYYVCPYSATISEVTITADVSGSMTIDVWKDTYANYPPTAADIISASAPITLSSAIKNQDSTLTGWTKTITAGDVLAFKVQTAATCTMVSVCIKLV